MESSVNLHLRTLEEIASSMPGWPSYVLFFTLFMALIGAVNRIHVELKLERIRKENKRGAS